MGDRLVMNETFGDRLRELMRDKKLTLAQIAEATRKSTSAVHKWTKSGEIEYETLRVLAKFLSVNWVWLRYGEEAVEDLRKELGIGEGFISQVRRHYFQQVEHDERLMRAALDTGKIIAWEWDLLTDKLKASPDLESFYGVPLEHFTELLNLMNAEDRKNVENKIKESIQGRHVYEAEFHVHLQDGTRHVQARATPLKDGRGNVTGFVGAAIDITDQAAIQLENTISRSHMRIVLADPDTKLIRYASAGVREATGYDDSELLGMDFMRLVKGVDDRQIADIICQLKDQPDCYYIVELKEMHKDGKEEDLEVYAQYVPGTFPSLMLVSRPYADCKMTKRNLMTS